MLMCKQEIVLTLGYLRSLKGQFFLGKEELLIEVCKIPDRTTPCCLSQADAKDQPRPAVSQKMTSLSAFILRAKVQNLSLSLI